MKDTGVSKYIEHSHKILMTINMKLIIIFLTTIGATAAFAMDSSLTAPTTKKLKMSSYLGDIEEGPPVSRKMLKKNCGSVLRFRLDDCMFAVICIYHICLILLTFISC